MWTIHRTTQMVWRDITLTWHVMLLVSSFWHNIMLCVVDPSLIVAVKMWSHVQTLFVYLGNVILCEQYLFNTLTFMRIYIFFLFVVYHLLLCFYFIDSDWYTIAALYHHAQSVVLLSNNCLRVAVCYFNIPRSPSVIWYIKT